MTTRFAGGVSRALLGAWMLLASPAFADDEPPAATRDDGAADGDGVPECRDCATAVAADGDAPPAAADGDAPPVAEEPTAPPREELERRGASIRSITIVVENVFDPSKPEENKRLYRWANKVHI